MEPAAPAPAGPKALDPTPPVLSLFRHDNIAVLRIHDLSFSGVVSAVVQSLPVGVTSLMLVTPTDTKMFAVNGGGGNHEQVKAQSYSHQRSEVGGEPELSAESDRGEIPDAYDPQLEAIRQAQEDESELESAQADAPISEPSNREAVREFRRATAVPASDPCQRCGGSGKIGLALPDGSATEAPCGVCRGAGVIRRFGVRR